MNPLHGIVQSRRLQLRSTYSCTQAVERRLLTCLTTSKLPQSSLYGLLLHKCYSTAEHGTGCRARLQTGTAQQSTAQRSKAQHSTADVSAEQYST